MATVMTAMVILITGMRLMVMVTMATLFMLTD